jgi:glucokinase
MLLAGDIGGTKTNLAIFSPEGGPRAPLAEATFPSAHYPSLEALASDFLAQVNLKLGRASFGVAGPVVGGQATITNLPWVMNETQLQAALNLSPVRLLNDLAAIAYAVPRLEPDDLYTLNAGQPATGGTMAVIAPGTGLGEAFLTTFVSILGTEAGNMALKVLATAGVYLGGDIPPRILSALENGRYMQAFRRKGRLSELMDRVPVHVILNSKVALLGAACHGLELSPD